MPVSTARSTKKPDRGRASLRGWLIALWIALAVCLRAAVATAQAPAVDPPLPPELSVWNWLRQSQWAPQTSFQGWRAEQQNPYGVASQAQWNSPAPELLPVPETILTAAVGSMADTRLDEGSLIEAVPPLEPIERQRPMQSSPIQLAQRDPLEPVPQSRDDAPDTGLQASETAPSDANAPAAPQKSSDDKKLGKAPVDYSRQFLRTQSVLLRKGQIQFDTGGAYGTVETNFPTVVNGNLTQGTLHRRLGYAPLQLRYGLTDRWQMFANVPVGYVCNEQTVLGSYANYSGRGGTGDTNLGLSYWLRKSNGCPFDPDIIATFGMTFPTAPASYLNALTTPQTSLGQGFWAAFWNVLVVQSLDPVTIFYGIGGRQLFGREVQGSFIQPGQQFTYQLGAGFAVNERVTFSAGYFGYFITDTYIDHQRLVGSFLEPQYIRLAVTVVREHRIIEPFVLFGTTEDAARSIVGINLTFY